MQEPNTERYYINYTWIFLGILLVHILIKDAFIRFNSYALFSGIIFTVVFAVLNLLKKYITDTGVQSLDYFYLRTRTVEIFFICFGFFYLNLDAWTAVFILGAVIMNTLIESPKKGLHTAYISMVLELVFILCTGAEAVKRLPETITFTFIIISSFAAWAIVSKILAEKLDSCIKSSSEIELAKKEKDEAVKLLKVVDEKSENIKSKLNESETENQELKVILEKYYELYNISSVITSIYDISGLLKYINETIIEVVGAEYSTIFLFESKRGSLEIEKTNIEDEDNMEKLSKSINNDVIFDIIENGSLFVVNFVDNDDYEFIRDRNVKSFVCMPISTTKKKYGVMLIESVEFNRYDEQTQKLITLIGHQLSSSIENLELYKKMKEIATTDALTGIFNRLYFQEKFSKELKIAHENDYPLSFVIFDIDHFKKFNDNYSHLVGDKVLKIITSVVKNSIRRTDIIARYGGEEFVIIFPNMDVERAEETCEMLRKKIETTPVKTRDLSLSVTVSFGVANYPLNAYSEENLIKAADRALYKAKNAGRNRVVASDEKIT
ncbi:MAG: diguanylate cyclase [Deltaproteobacteria bacterium]